MSNSLLKPVLWLDAKLFDMGFSYEARVHIGSVTLVAIPIISVIGFWLFAYAAGWTVGGCN